MNECSGRRRLPTATASATPATATPPLSATERLFLSAFISLAISAASAGRLRPAAAALAVRVSLFGFFGEAGREG